MSTTTIGPRPPRCRQHTRHRRDPNCVACRTYQTWYRRRYRAEQAAGTWRPMVDAEPVREHVRALLAHMRTRDIAAQAGVSTSAIAHLLYGKPTEGRPPTRTMLPAVADALLGVPVPASPPRPHRQTYLVDAVGTRRRVHALQTLGWPVATIASRADVCAKGLHEVASTHTKTGRRKKRVKRYVTRATATAVARVYDQLWQTPGPSTITARRAAAKRLPGPLAWDDDTIDDPNARPVTTVAAVDTTVDPIVVERIVSGHMPATYSRAERHTAIVHMAEVLGLPPRVIAARIGSDRKAVERLLSRHRTARRAAEPLAPAADIDQAA